MSYTSNAKGLKSFDQDSTLADVDDSSVKDISRSTARRNKRIINTHEILLIGLEPEIHKLVARLDS